MRDAVLEQQQHLFDGFLAYERLCSTEQVDSLFAQSANVPSAVADGVFDSVKRDGGI